MRRWKEYPDDIPIIVGVGESIDRPEDLAYARHPAGLMAEALQAAEIDAGVGLVSRLDRVEAILQVTWPYQDTGGVLAHELGIAAARVRYGAHGGHSPMRLIHEAAIRIANGESEIEAVCGGEAYHSLAKAKKAGVELPWPPKGPLLELAEARARLLHPAAVKLGASLPVAIYPFYENAATAAWGQTPEQAVAESGAIWSVFSNAAASNPTAWLRKPMARAEITEIGEANRMIAWPYRKFMVANPIVNQGAAVIVVRLGTARALGIDESKFVALVGGAAADEPLSFLDRDRYDHVPAQRAVLDKAAALAGEDGFAHQELYSCFPIVPKLATRSLGLEPQAELSLIGGLTFFGGPLNNYMTHATCELVRRLRGTEDRGLLYAQGGHLTHHHALVLAGAPAGPLDANYCVQSEADVLRGQVPALAMDYRGKAQLESFTVLFEPGGAPSHGIAIARTLDGTRVLARIEAAEFGQLTNPSRSPIGDEGIVGGAPTEVPTWVFTGGTEN